MPDEFIGEHSRQRILQVVKEVSFSIDYVLTITKNSISPYARAELTALMLAFFWEDDSQSITTRAVEMLIDVKESTMEDGTNIRELFTNSIRPVQAAPIFNIEFRDNQIEQVVVAQQPGNKDTEDKGGG